MRTIALADILIPPNRQRREFDPAALHELAESIAGPAGLIHAPLLRMQFDLENRGKTQYFLVAGERRLRAIADIFALGGSFLYDSMRYDQLSGIPYTLTAELTPLELREAELDENIRRSDLSWQERATAMAELAELRKDQAAAQGLPPPTHIDIAAEVGRDTSAGAKSGVRQEIILARHLDDPDVRAAKSVGEGFKILKRKEAERRNVVLAEKVGRTFTADAHTALNADSLQWLAAADAGQFDVILTDPPYGMGADEFGDSGGAGGSQGEHGYADEADTMWKLARACSVELYRIAKAQAHLYWFCDIDWFCDLKKTFEIGGWWVHRTPIIWHKPTSSRIPWPDHGPQRKWEMILYAVKGKKPATKVDWPDLVSYPPDAQLNHAAQKPVALFIDLLRRSVHPGDRVLDCFSGTGTIFPAAHELKCAATGIELDPANYAKGVQRIEALKAQLELAL